MIVACMRRQVNVIDVVKQNALHVDPHGGRLSDGKLGASKRAAKRTSQHHPLPSDRKQASTSFSSMLQNGKQVQ